MFYQAIALILLAAFYGCYFLKMIAQRKKGIKTDQIGKGKAGAARAIELTMKAVTYMVPAAEVISILLKTSALPNGARMFGAAVGAAGVAVFITSVVTMRDSWRAGVAEEDETDLVTDGIYRISRNPAFLGFDLVYIGILLMFFNWPLLLLSAFAALMFHLQIVYVEEVFLVSAFGDAYLEYKKTVCRYIGRR